jgi:hypothetical protein
MLQPNDLPIVCLPLELPPEAAAELIDFLRELTEALERHYAGALKCHYDDLASAQRNTVTDRIVVDDPSF